MYGVRFLFGVFSEVVQRLQSTSGFTVYGKNTLVLCSGRELDPPWIHPSLGWQSLGVWRFARWCNSSLDCIFYWLKIGANSSSSVLLRNYWLWLANLKIITLCVHCYLWTYSHIPALIESIEQHNKATWWLRCYTAWVGEGYWALLNCSISLWLNKHTTPTRGRKPTEGFTEGYKMSYPPPPCSHGGTYIQSFPVSVITFTTQLFGSTHKSTQYLQWGGGKHWYAYHLGKVGDKPHLRFNTSFKSLMVLTLYLVGKLTLNWLS